MLVESRLKTDIAECMRRYVDASSHRVAQWLVRVAPKLATFGAAVLADELAQRRAVLADELARHRTLEHSPLDGSAVQAKRGCAGSVGAQDFSDGAGTTVLTSEQIESYERDGYLLLRGQIDEASLQRFERGLEHNPPLDGETGNAVWPAPSRYTLAKNCLADSDLGFMAEHERIVPVAAALLEDDPVLLSFVVYDRTPGGDGLGAHHDYKRWRPIGSSLKWCFAIAPLTDFDDQAGPLYVAPGSHRRSICVSVATTSDKSDESDSSSCGRVSANFLPQELDRVYADHEQPLQVRPGARPADEDFIDPGLRRGDLLMMDMHLWHRAAPNRSNKSRIGIFNKYCARHFPPATGYYVFGDDVHDALSTGGRRLIAVHSDKPIGTTRALLERRCGGEREFLFLPEGDAWALPGGAATPERTMPEWDVGNYIASAQAHVRERVHIETPWMTYVGDYDEGNHLCRVYAYPLNDNGHPTSYAPAKWIPQSRLANVRFANDYTLRAIADWLDPSIVRGKGLSQAASRIDQFAY
jgi:ectoine hydroxylase-related dioxygenase (phytanoyl-CoA dioxygenase family)